MQRTFSWQEAARLSEIFEANDVDKNGFLNFQELFAALLEVDPSVDQAAVNQFIRRLGITQEKFISFGEFVKGIAYNLKQTQPIINKTRQIDQPVHDQQQTVCCY